MKNLTLNLPAELIDDIQNIVNRSEVSFDCWRRQQAVRWMISSVTERVEFEKKAQLLKNHRESANYPEFDRILTRVPADLPIAGDELSKQFRFLEAPQPPSQSVSFENPRAYQR